MTTCKKPPTFPKDYIVPPVIQYALLISYLYSTNTTTFIGNSWMTGETLILKKLYKNMTFYSNFSQK